MGVSGASYLGSFLNVGSGVWAFSSGVSVSDSRVSVAGAEYPLTPFVIECDLRDSAALAILSLDFLGELFVER